MAETILNIGILNINEKNSEAEDQKIMSRMTLDYSVTTRANPLKTHIQHTKDYTASVLGALTKVITGAVRVTTAKSWE